MFREIIFEATRLMKKNLNLAQIIFILFFIVSIFSPTIIGVKLNFKILPALVLWYALLAAFFAGLFYAFRAAVDYEKEPVKKENELGLSPLYFAEFFQGIGAYIKKFLAAGSIFVFLFLVVGFGYDYFVNHYVVIPKAFSQIATAELLGNDVKMMEFVNSLSSADILKMAKLSLFTLFVVSFLGYITMLYPVVLVSTEDNFLKAFGTSIKALFKNFIVSFMLFFFFNLALSMIAIISAAVANNIILTVLSILLQCYFNVLYLLALFVYYEKVR